MIRVAATGGSAHGPLVLDSLAHGRSPNSLSPVATLSQLHHHQERRTGKGMEKLIYVHLLKSGRREDDSIISKEASIAGSTNDWYLIKQSEVGDGVELMRVFEDASPPNHQGPALWDAKCQMIGSCIYVIGGFIYGGGWPYYLSDVGSDMIHFLDTRNPKDGWRTCHTFPFILCSCQSAVVDDQWLYIPIGNPCDDDAQDAWGYAVNVKDSKQVRKITTPGISGGFPAFATSLSPGTLVVCMFEENTWYQLDCENGTWTVYLEDPPYPSEWYRLCSTAVDDGILYIYDNYSNMRLISYDIRNKKELYAVDVPDSFWFGHEGDVHFIVLSKHRFCIIRDLGGSCNRLRISYTRFSVSCDLAKPSVDVEEKQIFHAVGRTIASAVAV